MAFRVTIAYSIVTPESAAEGDAAEHGVESEEIMSRDDTVRELESCYELSVGAPLLKPEDCEGAWATREPVVDWRNGSEETQSVHIADEDGSPLPGRVLWGLFRQAGLIPKDDPPHLDEFTQSYVEAALWSSTDESTLAGGEPMDRNYGIDDIAPGTLEEMRIHCEEFQVKHWDDIASAELASRYSNFDLAGYHFWLTRNGHGSGFWNGDWPDEIGERLTEASKAFGECNLYIGDDGMIHGSNG